VERDAGQSFIYNAMLQLTSVSGGGRDIQYSYSPTQNNGKIVSETDLVRIPTDGDSRSELVSIAITNWVR